MMTTTDEHETRQTLSVEQAAQRLGIGRSLAYVMVREGQIPAIKLGKRYLIPTSRFEAWLAGRS